MKPTKQKNKHNADRFGRDPVRRKDGKPVKPQMVASQIAILEFLKRNRLATFKDMHAYFGGDRTNLRNNISKLKSIFYIRIVAQHAKERNYSKSILYELDEPGIGFLTGGTRTIERPRAVYIEHAALTAHATTHMEIGVKNCTYARLIHWPEIKASKSIPPATIALKHPFGIPYHDPDDNETKHANGDAPIVGIELTLPDRKKFRFLDWEADTGSESEPTIRAKFKAWLIIEQTLEYQNHFGFPKGSFFVPWLCDRLYQGDRAAWLMSILSDMTDGKGSKMLLFMNYQANGAPGYVFNEPFLRVGYGPMVLSQ